MAMRLLLASLGIACAMPSVMAADIPVQAEWHTYHVLAPASTCTHLPKSFSVARLREAGVEKVFLQIPQQFWQWQLDSRHRTVRVMYWAEDLKSGVNFQDSLELAAAPPAKEFQRLLDSPMKPQRLACGGRAVPQKHWRAALPVIQESQLLDQTDLPDMESNPIAVVLSARLGGSHHH